MRARRRGHSLLEVMVAMALTGVLLLCTQQLLSAAARYFTNSQLSLELQQALLLCSSRVQVELGESNYACVVVDDGPPSGVVFITPRNRNGTVTTGANGKAQWGRMVCFYCDTMNGVPCLFWKERAMTSQAVPPYPAVPAPWDKVPSWTTANGRPHLIAKNITSFKVTDTTPLLIEMTASDKPLLPIGDPDPNAKFYFRVEARVHPKN